VPDDQTIGLNEERPTYQADYKQKNACECEAQSLSPQPSATLPLRDANGTPYLIDKKQQQT
jgi:hypothetical protein